MFHNLKCGGSLPSSIYLIWVSLSLWFSSASRCCKGNLAKASSIPESIHPSCLPSVASAVPCVNWNGTPMDCRRREWAELIWENNSRERREKKLLRESWGERESARGKSGLARPKVKVKLFYMFFSFRLLLLVIYVLSEAEYVINCESLCAVCVSLLHQFVVAHCAISTYFSSDSTCFSLSLKRYVGLAAISHKSFGRHSSLSESLILWLTNSKPFLLGSNCCLSVSDFLNNFKSMRSSSSRKPALSLG